MSPVRVLFLIVSSSICLAHGFALGKRDRFVRDVVDTAKNVYQTVSQGTKAVFHDLIGNRHVAMESYRQAQDASQKVAPAFQDIFVNQHKPTVPPGPPTRPTAAWEANAA